MSRTSPAICLYFQGHQPFRLIEYDFFRVGQHPPYENVALNEGVLNKVCERCYIPATQLFQKLIEETDGRFRLALSLSGILLEQLEQLRPDVLARFQKLVASGSVEILGETYHHSLASLFSEEEFKAQVVRHTEKVEATLGTVPRVFRNTELIYSNAISRQVDELGFQGVMAEGVTWLLAPRSPNHVFVPPEQQKPALLLRNAGLSDDFAFRYSDPSWKEYPVTPAKALRWVRESGGEVASLFMDLESLGEHQEKDSGIFKFWDGFVRRVVRAGGAFVTPSEAIQTLPAVQRYSCPSPSSWADHERDVSAWLGGAMQKEAATKLYSLRAAVLASGDDALLEAWRRLQTSDHLHYMCTKGGTDGMVHDHFRPYESAYDAYIFFMNVLADLEIGLPDVRPPQGLALATS